VRSVHVAVRDHDVTPGADAARELLCHGDGSMSAPGASDGDREVRLALALVLRERMRQQRHEILEELLGLR
jgi:hypothetical protein